jgi:hypothetical protein
VTERLTVPRLFPFDVEVLEERARQLAAGERAGEEATAGAALLVAFQLGGRACAVDSSVVERAVTRLAAPIAVPLADGGERLLAFVEERPVPVVDLAGVAAGGPRGPAALAGHPAVVVTTGIGSVAVAVDGPLDLLEERMAALTTAGDPAPIRAAGVLAGGCTALDAAWLQEWAEKAARS